MLSETNISWPASKAMDIPRIMRVNTCFPKLSFPYFQKIWIPGIPCINRHQMNLILTCSFNMIKFLIIWGCKMWCTAQAVSLMKKALVMEEIKHIPQSKSFAPFIFHVSTLLDYLNASSLSRYTLTTIPRKRRARIGMSSYSYACSRDMIWKITWGAATRTDPAVLPKWDDGETASTQNIVKASKARIVRSDKF